MLKVFKYPVPVADLFELEMPKDAQILTVQIQGEDIQMWALVDPESPTELRQFRLAGTGHSISVKHTVKRYIGTFQIRGGRLVFHLFEVSYPITT